MVECWRIKQLKWKYGICLVSGDTHCGHWRHWRHCGETHNGPCRVHTMTNNRLTCGRWPISASAHAAAVRPPLVLSSSRPPLQRSHSPSHSAPGRKPSRAIEAARSASCWHEKSPRRPWTRRESSDSHTPSCVVWTSVHISQHKTNCLVLRHHAAQVWGMIVLPKPMRNTSTPSPLPRVAPSWPLCTRTWLPRFIPAWPLCTRA